MSSTTHVLFPESPTLLIFTSQKLYTNYHLVYFEVEDATQQIITNYN